MTNAVPYKNVLVDRTRLLWVRLVLPVATAFVGVVLIVLGGETAKGAGVFLIGVAGVVLLANALIRPRLQSAGDRDRGGGQRPPTSTSTGAGPDFTTRSHG